MLAADIDGLSAVYISFKNVELLFFYIFKVIYKEILLLSVVFFLDKDAMNRHNCR